MASFLRRPASLAALVVLAVLATLGLLVEEARSPSLPVPFELAAAARLPTLAPWVGRALTAAAALAAIGALYTLLRRTAGSRIAGYGALVLVTIPAWFLHGRTLTGAMIPLACSAGVLAAAGLAGLDVSLARSARIACCASIAAFATIPAIFTLGGPARGLALVAGVPLVATGIAGRFGADRFAELGSAASLRARDARVAASALAFAGLLVFAGALVASWLPESDVTTLLLGARVTTRTTAPSFSALAPSLAYGLAPWSPFVALAITRRPTSAVHLALMIAAGLGVIVQTALTPRSGVGPTLATPAIAACIAFFADGLSSLRRPAMGLVVTVAVVGVLVAHDLRVSPERALAAFVAPDVAVSLPTTNANAGGTASSILAMRSGIWLTIVLSSFALLLPRDWLPTRRGTAIIGAGVVAGLAQRAHTFPVLLAQISPGAAFDTWAKARRPGEPLGTVGIDRRAVAFAPGSAVVPQTDPPAAAKWLGASPDARGRRFVAVSAPLLPALNAEWRAVHGGNVPILSGSAAGGDDVATYLAVNTLTPNEISKSPLDRFVLDAAPSVSHEAHAVFADRLELLGWDVVDDRGVVRDRAERRGSSRVRVVLRVLGASDAAPLGGHCTFLHVDHVPSRYSREHKTLAYPMSSWRPGDIVADELEITLGPAFRGATGAGHFAAYFGIGVLPCEDDRRMPITTGPNDGANRVPLGMLEVR